MGREAGSRNRAFPAHTLEKALQVVQAIVDAGASRPMDRLLVAQAINRTPSSSEFRSILSSSLKYGLTEGTEKADFIKPTPIGLQIAKPVTESERQAALLRAVNTPPLFQRVYAHFNKQRLPRADFFKNILERQFDVDESHADEVANLIHENARYVGVLQKMGTSDYINLDLAKSAANLSAESLDPAAPAASDSSEEEPDREASGLVQTGTPKQIFVAHGKKHGPLKEVQAILNRFKIPYVVAQEEAHAGRPISVKVAEMMRACSAGLFIFTKDEEFQDKDGTPIWRPSENVVFELGAGSVFWGKKIIILKEEGVGFASDYRDLGYITFQEGHLSSIGMQLFMEFIAFDFVKVQAA